MEETVIVVQILMIMALVCHAFSELFNDVNKNLKNNNTKPIIEIEQNYIDVDKYKYMRFNDKRKSILRRLKK